jgi:NTE family protein
MIVTMSNAIERKMNKATSYEEWKAAAVAYDERNGLERWKQYEKSSRYDYAAIRRRLEQMEVFREADDNHGLLFTLNEGIHGNLGGMGQSTLYQKAKFGTKQLIVDYVNEVGSALEHLSRPEVEGVTHQEKVEFFQRASLCFGRSALMMSGSGTFLFFHVGVLKALWEQDLLPEVISGASGGAFVAAVLGTRAPDQLSEIFTPEFISLEADLKSILSKFLPLQKRSEDISRHDLEEIVEKLVPDLTFAEAYELSGLQINISITPAEAHQKSRLLNAITSPNVLIREAVMASCCLPGVFAPVRLAAKNVHGEKVPYLPNRRWVDGSLSDDLPMKRLSRLYGVNHFIVSQTNPIVLPFVSAEKSESGVVSTIGKTSLKTLKDWGLAAGHLLQKPLRSDSYLSKLLNGYISVVSQTYTGDINIMPANRFLNPAKVISARSNEEILSLITEGEKATWPHIERIRIQTLISRKLWRIVKELDVRVVKGNPKPRKAKKLKAVG